MSLKSYPFKAVNIGSADAPVWDRSMSSADDASRLDLFTPGVVGEGDWKVSPGGGMAVSVSAGRVRMDGREGVIYDTPETVAVEVPTGGESYVVIAAELNLSEEVRAIRPVALVGSGGYPVLSDTAALRQIGLAKVLIPAGATAITAEMVTDIRPVSALKVSTDHRNSAGFLLLPGYLEKVEYMDGNAIVPAKASLFYKEITEDTAFTLSGEDITPGYACSVLLVLKMLSAAAVTFPAGVRWAGELPVLQAGYSYEILLRSYDGGVSWIGSSGEGAANA